MGYADVYAVAGAGLVAGAVNTLAGAGSLLTYPVLVGLGLAPVAANVTNDIGIIGGNVSGVLGLRHNLADHGLLLRRLVPRVAIGSLIGAVLLLELPAAAFAWAAPPLLLVASLLTLAQPALLKRGGERDRRRGRPFLAVVEAISVYGGYFGVGIGLLFMATLGLFVHESTRHLNAIKTVLQLVANGLAGVVFALVAPVHWVDAAALAGGSIVGGQLGAWLAGVIPAGALRAIVAVIGIGASAWLLARQV